jgi:hypothetical protein
LAHVPVDRLLVIAIHIPLVDSEGMETFRPSDRQALCRLLEAYPNVLVLSAHTHLQGQHLIGKTEPLKREKLIREYNAGAACGSWYTGILNDQGIPLSVMRDGTPPGYAFLRVSGNSYVLDYKVLGKPEGYRMSVSLPDIVPSGSGTKDFIYVNFFMGGTDELVEYRIDKGEWSKMQASAEADPAYLRYVADWEKQARNSPDTRRPPAPAPCGHLWKGELPGSLTAGEHQVEIRVKDVFGRVFTEKSVYRVLPEG